MSIGRDEWLVEVDRELRDRYSIGSVDAGWDSDEIDGYFSLGLDPKKFVEWFGEKYDLIEREQFAKS